jgi:transposase
VGTARALPTPVETANDLLLSETSHTLWKGEGVGAVVEWPANSPDLNPIEKLWNWLKNTVAEDNQTHRKSLEQH